MVTNIVICGGHLPPSLAVIEELKKIRKYRIHFIGRKFPLEKDKSISLEYTALKKLKIHFYPITSGRLQRAFTLTTFSSLAKFPIGILQSLYLLQKIKPKLVLSFGGYVALSVCIASWFLRIPIVTHEQTSILGLSNRIIARIAKLVCLSWPNTKNIPPGVTTILTGNPIRKSFFLKKTVGLDNFGDKSLPLLFVTGGSLGSRTINKIVAKVIPLLVRKYRVIHQCGSAGSSGDFKFLLSIKNSLPLVGKKNYRIFKHLDPSYMGGIFRRSSLVISRAGANTVAEIATSGVAAILIPLPWSGSGEQKRNGLLLESFGLAKVIPQEDLTEQTLLKTIELMENKVVSKADIKKKVSRIFASDGAERIVEVVDSLDE